MVKTIKKTTRKKTLKKSKKESVQKRKKLIANKLPTSLLIIGSKKVKWSTANSLIEESKKLFTKVVFVQIDKIQIQTSHQGAALFYKGNNLLDFDAIYPRFSSNDYLLAEPVLKIIEQSAAYCPVSLKSYQVSNHKYYTAQALMEKGIPSILTTLFISPKFSKLAVNETGYPFVMKLISGFAGKGVVLVKDKNQMESILDAVHLFEEFICTQQFVKSRKPGTDIRCYIFGDYVLTVKRTSKKGDWRSNISRGGSANLINASPELIDAAKASAKTLGMDVCAVDMMDKNGKWVVIEVNFMPGPFMKYLGNTVVHEWVKYIYKKVLIKKRREQRKKDKAAQME
jgi:ribosomal protein S6--L-glutamate ligase